MVFLRLKKAIPYTVKRRNLVRSTALQTLAFRGEEAEPPRLRLRGLSFSSTSRRSQVSYAPFHYRLINSIESFYLSKNNLTSFAIL